MTKKRPRTVRRRPTATLILSDGRAISNLSNTTAERVFAKMLTRSGVLEPPAPEERKALKKIRHYYTWRR